MTAVRELLACSIAEWYPTFRDVAFNTAILPVEDDVVSWLLEDGVRAASGNQAVRGVGVGTTEAWSHLQQCMPHYCACTHRASSQRRQQFAKRALDPLDVEARDWESGSESDSEEPVEPPGVTALRQAITRVLPELNGAVCPTFTWSCPKDAVWLLLNNQLRCTSADEVLLLLKSSDRVSHDICSALPDAAAAEARLRGDAPPPAAGAPPPERHVLALREWRALRPEREVRCFLRGRGIVGACQRDVTQAFAPLQSAAAREELLGAASDFVASVADRLPFGDIVLDVYVGSNKRVRLVDLNPVNGSTAPLLFSWEELGFDGLGGGEAEDRLETRTSCRDSGAEADATAPAAPPSAYLGQLRQAQASARKQHAVEELETGLEARMHVSQPDSKESASAPATSPARSTVPEFRFVREGETPMRPSAAMYGIPYDFVDASEGSALATLLEQAKNATGVWQGLQRQADAIDPKN